LRHGSSGRAPAAQARGPILPKKKKKKKKKKKNFGSLSRKLVVLRILRQRCCRWGQVEPTLEGCCATQTVAVTTT
jgi:hypothetical protein